MRFRPLARQINILNILLLTGVIGSAFYLLPALMSTKVNVPSQKTAAPDTSLPLREISTMIKEGDTLESLSDKYSISLEDLRQLNNIKKSERLKPGQRLVLKRVAPKTYTVKEEKPAEATSMSSRDYSIIAEQNLFHSERKMLERADTAALAKPEFVLYGTMITTNGLSIAYMEDLKAPSSSPGRGKRQMALRMGAQLSGYTLSEVHHDKVVMARNTDKLEVRVLDNKHRTAKTPEGPQPLQPRRAQAGPLTTTRDTSARAPLPSIATSQPLTTRGGIQAPPAVNIRRAP